MPFPFPDPDPRGATATHAARQEAAATAADDRTEVPAITRWELRHTRGMTGRTRRMAIAAAAIDEDAATRIATLMGASRFTELPMQMGPVLHDGDRYEITAAADGWSHTVAWTNRSATPELTRMHRALEVLGTWIPED